MNVEKLYVISGVTGMTGSELVKQLLLQDVQIIGFDNFFASSIDAIADVIKNPKFTFFEYDLADSDDMNALEEYIKSVKKNKELIYINCAAVVHTEHFYEINSTFECNVLGMKGFLEQAIRLGASIYINCSTSEVYSMESWNENGGMRESDFILLATAEHSQRTSYAAGKLLTEFFMKDAVDKCKIKGCSIRFANVYSDNELYPKHIIPHIFKSLIEKGSVTLLENSKVNRRTFLHNHDSCSSIIALIDSEKALDGTTYNVATDEEVTIVELVGMIGRELGIDTPQIVFEGYRTSDPERRVLCTEKIVSCTAWRPSVALASGLKMCMKKIKS